MAVVSDSALLRAVTHKSLDEFFEIFTLFIVTDEKRTVIGCTPYQCREICKRGET